MKVEVLADAESVAKKAAAIIAADARATNSVRYQFHMAVSGGNTPRLMVRHARPPGIQAA